MAYLLDTVTLSELRKKSKASPPVIAWQTEFGVERAYVSVVSMNEIRYGIRRIETRDPDFAKRLEVWYREILAASDLYSILPVNLGIAEQAADYRADHGLSVHDSLIAAACRVHNLILATRNIADFATTGIPLTNPWDHLS